MNLRKILKLVEKNFKLVWKSKLFVLLILLGPLLLTIFLGLAFNNSKDYSIRVSVYSENYDGVKNDILNNLKDKFIVIESDVLESCINSVKSYETHICVMIPPEINLEGDELSEVVFYVDNSRVNLVWVVLDSLSNVLSLSSQQLSAGMTSDLLGRLSIAERKSSELQKQMDGVLEQSESSVLLVEDVAEEMALLNLVKLKRNIEDSLVFKESVNKDLKKIVDKVREGKIILKNISGVLGNGSTVSGDINKLSEKLIEIEKLAGDESNLDQLNNLLEEANKNFESLERNLEVTIKKNNGALVLLKQLKSSLLVVDGLVGEMNIAVSNLKVTRADKIVEPIRTKIEPVSVEKTYLGFIFPTLVMLIIVFVSVLLSSSLVVMEKKNRAFFRNLLSKGWGLNFILSYFITNLMILLVDIFVFILIARFVFSVFINLGFLILIFLIGGVFVLLGLVIGFLTKDEQSNVLIGIVVSSVLVFFSNTLIPIESAAGFLSKMIEYNPFVIGERLLRKVLMPGMSFIEWRHDFLMIFIYFLVLAIALVLLSVVCYEKKSEFENLFKERIWRKWKK